MIDDGTKEQCNPHHWLCGPLSGVQVPAGNGYEWHKCRKCGLVKHVAVENPIVTRARAAAVRRWGT